MKLEKLKKKNLQNLTLAQPTGREALLSETLMISASSRQEGWRGRPPSNVQITSDFECRKCPGCSLAHNFHIGRLRPELLHLRTATHNLQ